MEIALGQYRAEQALVREAGDDRVGLPPLRGLLQGEDAAGSGGHRLAKAAAGTAAWSSMSSAGGVSAAVVSGFN
jgi:hypothetical protein